MLGHDERAHEVATVGRRAWRAVTDGDLSAAARTILRQRGTPPNKGMKLTKLSAAWLPAWTCRLMPAPVNGMDAGTASQLIPGVRRT